MAQNKLFIHCGLHKTGTTALQTAFLRHQEKLKAAGFLYPQSGRLDVLGGGHHNLAWQVAGDRRFTLSSGGFERLRAEVSGFLGDVVISSEDFETLLDSVAKLEKLINFFAPLGREIVFVIYCRNQKSYCQSIFIENICQNIGTDYLSYVYEAVDFGRMRLRDWIFQFDYFKLLANLKKCSVRFVFRNFHALHGESVISDFAHFLGVNPHIFGSDISLRSNEPVYPIDWLVKFLENRMLRPLVPFELEAVQLIKQRIAGYIFRTSPETTQLFEKSFAAGNKLLCLDQNISESGLNFNIMDDDSKAVYFERVFSSEFQFSTLKIRQLLERKLPEQASMMSEIFANDAMQSENATKRVAVNNLA